MLTSCSLLARVACLPLPIPHYPVQLWAPASRIGRLMTTMNVSVRLGASEQDKHANVFGFVCCFFYLVFYPPGDSKLAAPLVQIVSPDCCVCVQKDDMLKNNRAASRFARINAGSTILNETLILFLATKIVYSRKL